LEEFNYIKFRVDIKSLQNHALKLIGKIKKSSQIDERCNEKTKS